MSWIRFLVFLQATALLTVSLVCDSQEDDQPQGIILGKSIAGIEIGMDSMDVKDRLGLPDEIIQGDFPGVIYLYKTGESAGLEIEYSGLPEFGSGVASVCATEPYDGRTASGWGLGSPRSKPFAELGDSLYDLTIPSDFWEAWIGVNVYRARDRYNLRTTVFDIEFVNNSADWSVIDAVPIGRICFQAIPEDRTWAEVTDVNGKFYQREYGRTSRPGLFDGCLHVTTFDGHWKLACFLGQRPEQDIPEGFRKDSVYVRISGYQAPKSGLYEHNNFFVINTIEERQRKLQ